MSEEQIIVKDALAYVKAAEGVGVDRTKLLSALRTPDGRRLSPEQADFIFGLLTGRGWITHHLDPLWHARRWTITDAGLIALEAM